MSQAELLALQFLALAQVFVVGQEVAHAKFGEIVELADHAGLGLLDGIALHGRVPGLLFHRPFDVGQHPLVEPVREGNFLKEADDLLLQPGEGHAGLAAPPVQVALRAMVVGIDGAVAVFVVRGSHGAAALAAADHAGEGEQMFLMARLAPQTENLLDPLEFFERDHRLVLAGERPAFPVNDAGIEGLGEHFVDEAQGWRAAARALALSGAETPLADGDLPDLARSVCSREHELPHLPDQREPVRVGDDSFGVPAVQIPERGHVRPTAILGFGAVAASDVLAQGVHVILGVPEDD